jgi:hypothetical protein
MMTRLRRLHADAGYHDWRSGHCPSSCDHCSLFSRCIGLRWASPQVDKNIDWAARTTWIQAKLLEGMQPDQTALETLARQRAQAVQAAILANTAVTPERLFITTDRTGSLASDGRVRMELKLE